MLPFNLDLLILDAEKSKYLLPITSLDVFVPSSKSFHPFGLYSTEIFGKVGEERRNRKFGYVDTSISVFHPVVFYALVELKRLYGEILSGSKYARWNPVIKDFEKVELNETLTVFGVSNKDKSDVGTGYAFFLKYFKEIKFEKRKSQSRDFNIRLVEKYKNKCLLDKVIVMPAGLRDLTVNENGQSSDNEINDFYRKIMSLSNHVTKESLKTGEEQYDRLRYNLQIAVNNLYDYIISLIEGKKKFLQGKWGSRNVFNSTRNVITAIKDDRADLFDRDAISVNQAMVGLYQYLKASLPVSIHKIRNGIISKVFVGPNSPAVLINKETLKPELVNIEPDYYDSWMTDEGMEKVITRFSEEDMRHLPIEIGGRYASLTYRGPDGTFALFQNIDELPEGRSKEHVKPTTYAELFYTAVYSDSNKARGFITRYPISGYGSIYPCMVYLRTTTKAQKLQELDPVNGWTPKENGLAREFPIFSEPFYNSLGPAKRHLKLLGADFDGDVCSFTIIFTDEAIAEHKRIMNSRNFFVSATGNMTFSAASDTLVMLMKSITK